MTAPQPVSSAKTDTPPAAASSSPKLERQDSKNRLLQGSVEALDKMTRTLSLFSINATASPRRSSVSSGSLRPGSHARSASVTLTQSTTTQSPRLHVSDTELAPATSKHFTELLANDFPVMTEEAVRELSKEERTLLTRRLKDFQEALKPPYKPSSSAASAIHGDMQKHDRIAKTLGEIRCAQEEICDERLLKSLAEENGKARQLLTLSNESVIKTQKLFALIRQKLSAANEPKLLLFCAEWTEANRLTVLFNDAQAELQAIAEAHPLMRQVSECVAPNTVSSEQKLGPTDDFLILLKEVKDGNKNVSQALEAIVSDMFLKQVSLFMALTAHDLILDKWPNKQSTAFRLNAEYSNKMEAYLRYLVLNEPQESCKAKIVAFFLQVAHQLLKRRDVASAFIIFSAFNNASLTRSAMVRQELESSEIYRKLSKIFDFPFKLLKEKCQKWTTDKRFHIAPLVIASNRVAGTEGACGETTADRESYNLQKIACMKERIDEFLLPQSLAPQQPVVSKTNLHTFHFVLFDPLLAKSTEGSKIVHKQS